MLGYGYTEVAFKEGLARNPHVIAADAGSTDAGPHKLGAGVGIVSREATKKDLTPMLIAGCERNIPIIIGSAGGSGAKPHVTWTLDIVKEIAREHNLQFKVAVIWADIPKDYVKTSLNNGRIKPLGPVPDLTEKDLNETISIVAQMGVEPYLKALDSGAQVIIAGRSYDPVMSACLGIKNGFNPGLALHMGKILECGSQCAIPGSGGDCMIGYLRRDSFILEPLNPIRKCTETSVAAHTLYEKSHPYLLPGPGGHLDLSECTFKQVSARAVEVRGSEFIPSSDYMLKLEGAALAGYRTFTLAGIRDPIFIQEIDESLQSVKDRVVEYFSDISPEDYVLQFRVYGRDAVMGPMEPLRDKVGHELGLVIDVVAQDQKTADMICSFARSTLMHYHYKGRIATAGNLAFPYAPSDVRFGRVYKFTVYHLVKVDDPCGLFPIEIIEI